MKNDKILIDKIINGDKNSFSELVDNYKRLVAHIVYSYVNNRKDGEDLCQEIFLKVYVNLSSFNFKSKLSTWIGRISYNTCINYCKKKRITVNDNIDLKEIEYGGYKSDTDSNTRKISEIMKETLQKLPQKYRTVTLLFYMDGLSYKEISKILGLSLSNVKVILFRSRKKLKKKILEKYKEEDLWL
ncbi:MAG: sigma-70 family RNA polymerase sigma factor [Candidatus Marinimicrobia bacterium]|nr:sigma-70 family RNA polymerase sigma factor [Candidatus Neomarinimicrobiota bacterium]